MRPIDPYSYHCGVMDSFCEIVGAGVKPMALSHPFASPEDGLSAGSMPQRWRNSTACCSPRRTACR